MNKERKTNRQQRQKDNPPRGLRVRDLLGIGRSNARTARELADVLKCDCRAVTLQIERERRDGAPICASCFYPAGYYLAEGAGELKDYCRRLESRGREITRTRQALEKTLHKMT